MKRKRDINDALDAYPCTDIIAGDCCDVGDLGGFGADTKQKREEDSDDTIPNFRLRIVIAVNWQTGPVPLQRV